jgi:hypothetical protein
MFILLNVCRRGLVGFLTAEISSLDSAPAPDEEKDDDGEEPKAAGLPELPPKELMEEAVGRKKQQEWVKQQEEEKEDSAPEAGGEEGNAEEDVDNGQCAFWDRTMRPAMGSAFKKFKDDAESNACTANKCIGKSSCIPITIAEDGYVCECPYDKGGTFCDKDASGQAVRRYIDEFILQL